MSWVDLLVEWAEEINTNYLRETWKLERRWEDEVKNLSHDRIV